MDDIRNQRFKTKFNGLDKNDVMTYLQLVADDFEAFQKEAEQFKDQLEKKEKTIKKYKDREEKMKSLFETLCKEKGISLNELYNEKSVNKNPAEMGE
ncbi:MAG TPA: DivIVA domain-containing protein, partial [Nitrospinota bacterium]|nr:DivIVA domain-containing protein [Nitrospinota bacterium]